ncbi:MAG: IS1182 family transposase [Burkholderiaceae bacterium]|nr:IS1182 family transposase [Burkholderiaceae bacterium]
MRHFRQVDRQTDFLLPPSLDDWLSEDHLARFVIEAIEQTDLSKITVQYAGRGSAAYHPEMLLALLIYSYATGVFSSRRIELATHESVPFRYISANTHPDHDTIATFRRRFINEFADIFLQVLKLAHEMKVLQLGQVSIDGSKIHADASKHSALSYGHIEKLEKQFKDEVAQLMLMAENADQAPPPAGMNLPEEIKRREDRLASMAAAKTVIEQRAKARYGREKSEFDAKMAQRAEKEKSTGKKTGGRLPKAPDATPRAEDQVNLTDDESAIMKMPGGGYEQCYNSQIAVDTDSMLVVAAFVTAAGNDKQQIAPMVAQLQALPEPLGRVDELLADTGFYSGDNVDVCEEAQIDAYIAVGREVHHPGVLSRFSEPEPLLAGASAVQKMRHKLQTQVGRVKYAARKCTVEPVFGIIKSVLGFRQFSLRGIEKADGEWTLVCLAWNLKRMAKLRPSCGQ